MALVSARPTGKLSALNQLRRQIFHHRTNTLLPVHTSFADQLVHAGGVDLEAAKGLGVVRKYRLETAQRRKVSAPRLNAGRLRAAEIRGGDLG